VVGRTLPPAHVDLRTYAHDLELSGLVIELEREFGAERIATEREMRAADTPVGSAPIEQPRFAVPCRRRPRPATTDTGRASPSALS